MLLFFRKLNYLMLIGSTFTISVSKDRIYANRLTISLVEHTLRSFGPSSSLLFLLDLCLRVLSVNVAEMLLTDIDESVDE